MMQTCWLALRDQNGTELTKRVEVPYDRPPRELSLPIIRKGYVRQIVLFEREQGGQALQAFGSTGVLHYLRPPGPVHYFVTSGEADG
jgi:hypothetical protein